MIGKLSNKMLDTVIEMLPVEFSVLDANDKVLAWNRHDSRIFKRSKGVLGRDVRSCHPKKSLYKVERILNEMKEGTRDKAEFWIDISLGGSGEKRKISIQYFALRDEGGKYLGCLEVTQDVTHYRELRGEKRLLD